MINKTILTAALMMAVPALAQSNQPDGDQIDRFVAVLVANGCVINEQSGPAIQAETGFDDETLVAITFALMDEGRISFAPETGFMELTEGECS